MKKQRLFGLIALVCLSFCSLFGQEVKVKSFSTMERDLYPRTHERLDLNDQPCAVIRVMVPKAQSFRFEGNVVGEPIYSPGEAIVYMSEGSKSLTVKSDEFGSVKFEFPDRIKKQVAYRLELKMILSEDQKTRTLVMPVAGVGPAFSSGVMLALVKKTGVYVKVKYNFVGLDDAYSCNSEGIVEGDTTPSFYTGGTRTSRLALTGGLIQRLARPFYLYVGGGWGYKKLGWELSDGQWAKNTDKSYQGYEAELGGVFRIKNVALMAGVQSNGFKYWEGSVGVGIMF